MTRRSLFTTFAAIVAGLVMSFAATTNTASAQQDLNCCNYFVDVGGVGQSCFRVLLWTRWSTGVIGPNVFAANGVYPFAAPSPGVCPPAATFVGASLTGPAGPFATFNNPVRFTVNGCCLVVRIAFDVNGCPYIYIRPC